MNATPFQPTPPTAATLPPALGAFRSAGGAAAPSTLLDAQRSFAAVLSRAEHRADATTTERDQLAREAAESLVALSFVQPMLEEFREGGTAAPPFAPGPAEKQFRALMDAELAQRIVRASRFPLVERLAQDVLRLSAPDAPATATDAARPTGDR